MLRLFILLFLSFSAVASPTSLPAGCRLPTTTDIEAVPMRQWSDTNFLRVDADFNVDGTMDYAHLVKSTTYSGEGFAVYLSNQSGHAWTIIDSYEYDKSSPKQSLFMGISKANPGSYKTACGKGYWKCKEGEPEILELEHDGIAYFLFESASSIWFWDHSKNKFRQIGISD